MDSTRICKLYELTKIMMKMKSKSEDQLPCDYVRINTMDVDVVLPIGRMIVEDGRAYAYATLYDLGQAFYAIVFDEDGGILGVCIDNDVFSWMECIDNEPKLPTLVELSDDLAEIVVNHLLPSNVVNIPEFIEANIEILWQEYLRDIARQEIERKLEKFRRSYYENPVVHYDDLRQLLEDVAAQVAERVTPIKEEIISIIRAIDRCPDLRTFIVAIAKRITKT